MKECWSCGNKIDSHNTSKEHIIPNALFGKLRSNYILCKTCNSEFSKIDESLVNDLDSISIFLNAKRDRGASKPLGAMSKAGDPYLIKPGGKVEIKTQVDRNGNNLSIKVSNKKKLKEIKEGLGKKYTIQSATNKEIEEYLGPLTLENKQILSDETFRAATKIASNFYTYNGFSKENIESIIDYVKNSSNPKDIAWIYYGKDIYISKDSCEVLHSIILKGSKKERILYCYIELYGALNFLVLLSNGYKGENFEKTYFFDIEMNKEVDKNYEISLKRKKIEKILKNQKLSSVEISENMGKIGNKLLSKRAHDYLIELISETMESYPDPDLKDTWDKIKQKLEKYPHWDIYGLCPYHVKTWDQNGPECSCGSRNYVFNLIGMHIKGNVIAILLQTICKNCEKMLIFEFKTSLSI
ncbi:MAG: hypothetical protein HZC47_05260 [Methanobacterium sp.]|uniref:HNH endonuclease n=1 Tax=Methanobacterium sp. TaxID=2164 RepID=UPI003D65D3B5|nr:hypothetical protein [Methanobacterium sp.]